MFMKSEKKCRRNPDSITSKEAARITAELLECKQTMKNVEDLAVKVSHSCDLAGIVSKNAIVFSDLPGDKFIVQQAGTELLPDDDSPMLRMEDLAIAANAAFDGKVKGLIVLL